VRLRLLVLLPVAPPTTGTSKEVCLSLAGVQLSFTVSFWSCPHSWLHSSVRHRQLTAKAIKKSLPGCSPKAPLPQLSKSEEVPTAGKLPPFSLTASILVSFLGRLFSRRGQFSAQPHTGQTKGSLSRSL
jgi:hypothetical protein